MYEKFLNYKEKIEQDLTFDEFTVYDLCKRLPSLKHFWVSKLIEAKIDLEKFKKEKNNLIKVATEKFKSEIGLKKETALQQINASPNLLKINESIKETELIIEYLEKVEKVFSSTSYDIKNVVELLKMQQM